MEHSGVECPSRRIETIEKCRNAARAFSYEYARSWYGPNDVPGCVLSRQNNQVFFNTAPNARIPQADFQYHELCLGVRPENSGEYRRLFGGGFCTYRYDRITTEEKCLEACEELNLPYSNRYLNKRDVPGCYFANDGRSLAYFNMALRGDGVDPNLNIFELCENLYILEPYDEGSGRRLIVLVGIPVTIVALCACWCFCSGIWPTPDPTLSDDIIKAAKEGEIRNLPSFHKRFDMQRFQKIHLNKNEMTLTNASLNLVSVSSDHEISLPHSTVSQEASHHDDTQ